MVGCNSSGSTTNAGDGSWVRSLYQCVNTSTNVIERIEKSTDLKVHPKHIETRYLTSQILFSFCSLEVSEQLSRSWILTNANPQFLVECVVYVRLSVKKYLKGTLVPQQLHLSLPSCLFWWDKLSLRLFSPHRSIFICVFEDRIRLFCIFIKWQRWQEL